MKTYQFARTVTVPDALRKDVSDAGPVYGPRAFQAGERITGEDLHPGCLESCLRLGHLAEAADEEPEAPAPAPPADGPADDAGDLADQAPAAPLRRGRR